MCSSLNKNVIPDKIIHILVRVQVTQYKYLSVNGWMYDDDTPIIWREKWMNIQQELFQLPVLENKNASNES